MGFSEYLDQLTDPATRLKVADFQRLAGLPSREIKALRSRWSGLDVRRRRRIIQELTDLAEDNVELDFDAVFVLGLSDDDPPVRLQSIRGLWEHEGPDILDALLEMLAADEDVAVRAEAALNLSHFVDLHEEGRLRDRHFLRVEEGLRAAIHRSGEEQEVRARALEAIGAHNEQWVRDAIRGAYESAQRRLKIAAVHAMGRSCDDRWLPLLVRELSSDDAEVRYEAAVASASLGDERAIPHLIKLVLDPDEEVKQAAISALGEIGGLQAREALLLLLESESEVSRQAAAEALTLLDFEEDPLAFRQRL
jgi:HEAT repeat protein